MPVLCVVKWEMVCLSSSGLDGTKLFLAIFTQATAGFGLVLVSMPLLVRLLGVHTAMPLVALVGATAEVVTLARYRHTSNLRAVSWF